MLSEKEPPEKKVDEDKELPAPWNRIQGAIWLVGLAVLAWKGWWWPGILVLVAMSGLTEAAIQVYLSRRNEAGVQVIQEQQLARERGEWLPDVCPNCGAPLSVSSVHWSGPNTADCPYCNANLKKPS